MTERQRVASIDFDGVVFGGRIPAQMAIFKWAFMPWKYNRPFVPKFQGPPIEQRPSQVSLTSAEQKELNRHAKRKVKEGMKEFLEQLDADIKMGNTGRPNSEPMTSMTQMRLEEAGISGEFNDIRYKPEGISSDEGKYWRFVVIKQNGGKFTHYDDNAYFIKRMAPLFPEDEFVIVQDLTSSLLFSEKEMRKNPNVRRVSIDRKGKVKQQYPPLSAAKLKAA